MNFAMAKFLIPSSSILKLMDMQQTKVQSNGKPVKKAEKKAKRKKSVPGSREAMLDSIEIIKKYNLDFSYLNQ